MTGKAMLQDCLDTRNDQKLLHLVKVSAFRMAYAWTNDIDIANTLVDLTCESIRPRISTWCKVNWLCVYQDLYQHSVAVYRDQRAANLEAILPLTSPHDRHLHKLLQDLPLIQRIALTLVDIAELDYLQVSLILDKNRDTVQYWIANARHAILTRA